MKVALSTTTPSPLHVVPLPPPTVPSPAPEPETCSAPEAKPADGTPEAKLRTVLTPLLTQSGPITPANILSALDEVYPCLKKSRKIVPAPGRNTSIDKTPIPSITVGGRYLEDAGFRVSKQVTVRIFKYLVVITEDNPGPDPKVDAEYERIAGYRQTMADIQDRILFGRPVREILTYAAKMEAEERRNQTDKPRSAPR